MARPINKKCMECSKIRFEPYEDKPECYKKGACEKKKCYYRRLEYYRQQLRKNHIYLRFKDDHCLLCDSKENLEVHHIQAQSIGGKSHVDNLITLCRDCHLKITSYHRAMRLRFNSIIC